MESLDFVIVIIPLSIVVATLTALVYYYAHKEEINSRKNAKLIQSFIEKRVKQQAAIKNELEHIEALYRSRSINESIYHRLQNVILMTQERQRFEAMTMLDPEEKGGNKKPETPPKSPQLGKEPFWLTNEMPTEEQEITEVKDETEKKQKRKRTRKAKTRRKKKTETGLIDSANPPESASEEELRTSTT
jgi:hypothetical protein